MRRVGVALLLVTAIVAVGAVQGCGAGEPLLDEPAMYQGSPGRTGEYSGTGPGDAPQLAWKFETDNPVWSTPAVYGGMLYFSSGDGRLYALDAATGKKKWSKATGEWGAGVPAGSPAVSDGIVYFGGADGYLYAVDARTGKQKWRYQAGASGLVTPGYLSEGLPAIPAVLDGVVYFLTEEGEPCALDALSGEQKWRHGPGDGFVNYPVAVLDRLVFASDLLSPRIKAVDADDGQLVWRVWSEDPRESIFCTAVSGETVYVSGSSGCHALDAKTGEERWLFDSDQLTVFPPAISGGLVYVGSRDGRLLALDARDGLVRWEHVTGGEVSSAAALADGTLYYGTDTGSVYALAAQTGAERWEYTVGSKVSTSVVAANSMVFFGSVDGCVYALK